MDHAQLRLHRSAFDEFLTAVREAGYDIFGPVLRDGAIRYGPVDSGRDLPEGWTDVQNGGSYRLEHEDSPSLFSFAVGQDSWKKYLFPPVETLVTAQHENGAAEDAFEPPPAPKLAFLGIRPCELNAIQIQDRVFTGGPYVDPAYASRRDNILLIAVNCTRAGGTCFCASMGSGPRAASGYDLVLTEVVDVDDHFFVLEAGSAAGESIARHLRLKLASDRERATADALVERTAGSMGRAMDAHDLKALLSRNYDHPRWSQVASRCLTCGNCTMVCPTCFCSAVEDTTDLSGRQATRQRRWDSCFTVGFSYIHGGSVRQSSRSRYRQWMTHKLGTWWDQFDTSGCVGCGRCITWCPVGIDITEEVAAIRATDGAALVPQEESRG